MSPAGQREACALPATKPIEATWHVWGVGATAVALDVLLAILPRNLHLAANLAGGGLAVWFAAKSGADSGDLGLRREDMPRGAVYGTVSAALGAAILLVVMRSAAGRALPHEPGIAEATPGRAVYEIVLRIPIGTALAEELIFRGALLAVLARGRGRGSAVVASSLLFGIWHIVPALKRHSGQAEPEARAHRVAWVLGSVAATSAAGFALAALRYASGSVVAPWLAHAAANNAGYIGVRVARRQSHRAVEATGGGSPAAAG